MELNEFLQSVDSPAANRTTRIPVTDKSYSPYGGNSERPRWDYIQAGTATLGGERNQSGLLEVKNAAGSVIVQADNTGITINDGALTVQDANGTTILDGNGLTTSNFVANATAIPTNKTIVAPGSFANIPNYTLSVPLTKQAVVRLDYTSEVYSNVVDIVAVQLAINGTQTGSRAYNIDNDSQHPALHSIVTLPVGTHTFTVQGSAGTNNFETQTGYMSYLILGANG